jgi:hypothetical protein
MEAKWRFGGMVERELVDGGRWGKWHFGCQHAIQRNEPEREGAVKWGEWPT